MGSFNSKSKERLGTPVSRPNVLKRIEDPRSPTEEISRTPIEVTEKCSSGEMFFSHRANALKEQNQFSVFDSSPRLRRNDFFEKDFKKSKPSFDSVESADTDRSVFKNTGVAEKENNEL